MSARIGQIIEVIEEVRALYRGAALGSPLDQVRIAAVHAVAARRRITYQAVIDKLTRQLSPDIVSATKFDQFLKSWLTSGSADLQNIVLRHIVNPEDEHLIRSVFHRAPDEDLLLAEEFGLDANDSEFKEGREKLLVHLIKERNRHLVAFAKAEWIREGKMRCAVCSFSFAESYGASGVGYIEAHHTTPISALEGSTIVTVSDLVPVCSNCHGFIHRHRPWLSIDQIRAIHVAELNSGGSSRR